MPEMLLELGCEELPATFVRKAYTDLQNLVFNKLQEAGLTTTASTSVSLGTPRRLIVRVTDVLERQEGRTEEIRGPGLKVAFDESGNPTPALLGFCKKNEADPGNVRKDDQHVWVTKHVTGRPAVELLSELLPVAIRGLSFEKSMRWGATRMRFARPIRWILASFGGKVIPFDIEGVQAGLESRGHRFYAPHAFPASNFDELLTELRQRKVEPDEAKRKASILEQTRAAATGTPDLPEALVDENTFLTEWPVAVAGHYKDEFKNLPSPVLVTAMAKHEKMFPVRDADGTLTTQFVFIRNGGEDETVRAGNEWVLNARFNDAKFFYEQDIRHDLEFFLEKTRSIVFQEKLGTVRERADRLASLAVHVAKATGADSNEEEFARLAGRFCKADLSTGLVSEFASLQGVVGGEYAGREGKLAEPVCWAIATHYDLSKSPSIDTDGARTAVRVIISDQLDKLAGYLGLGIKPTGTADPYGLRRAATQLIEAAWRWPSAFYRNYDGLILDAATGYEIDLSQRGSVESSLAEIFRSRYESLLDGERRDVLEAATLPHLLDFTGDSAALNPRLIRLRVHTLNLAREDEAFVQTATRPLNIAGAARKKGIEFDSDLDNAALSKITSLEGQTLLSTARAAQIATKNAILTEDSEALLTTLKGLAQPINAFFDATMIMAEDEHQRFANHTLVNAVAQLFLQAGDFSKLVFEGA